MTRTATSIVALAFALSAGSAIAADRGIVNNATGEGVLPRSAVAASKTTQQVRAELAEAVRSGAVIANNATGETVRSANASGFEAGLTRAQVKAELAEAIRNGDVIANNATLEKVGDAS